MDRKRVLFICVGNTTRSLMAEAILRSRAGDRYDVASAGVRPSAVPEQTLQVLAEAGIDTNGLHNLAIRLLDNSPRQALRSHSQKRRAENTGAPEQGVHCRRRDHSRHQILLWQRLPSTRSHFASILKAGFIVSAGSDTPGHIPLAFFKLICILSI